MHRSVEPTPSRPFRRFRGDLGSRDAFTLVEILLVLGLLAVLSGVVLPAVGRWQSGLPMQRAEAEVRDALFRSRAAAIAGGRPCGFQFHADSELYRTIETGAAGPRTTDHRLAGGVRFGGVASGRGWEPPILFTADGIAADATISLVDAQGNRSRLRLRRLTGSVTIEPDE